MEEPRPFPARWGVARAEFLADTPTSRVWEVTLTGGDVAVVKDLKPLGVKDELPGVAFLEWRDGEGAVRVLHREGNCVLMEHAGRYSLRQYLDIYGDGAASEVAAEAVRRLHGNADRPSPEDLWTLRRRFASLFAKAEADRKAGVHSLFIDAARVAEHLLANQKDVRPLHGDLHHENLLHGDRGWLAIDPKGLAGDPAYDVANLFCNPLGREDLTENPARAASLAQLLARALGRDEKTILQYGFAHACLSASWHLEDGDRREAECALAIARAVRETMRL